MYRVIEREGDQIKYTNEHTEAIDATTEAIKRVALARKQKRHINVDVEKGNDAFGFYVIHEYSR